MEIRYIHEPTDLQCGQAVLAMLGNVSVDDVISFLGNDRETTLSEMKHMLDYFGILYINERKTAQSKDSLPKLCILSLETPRCWHWSLYHDGIFYDPEHGVMDDFPVCNRKFYWELISSED